MLAFKKLSIAVVVGAPWLLQTARCWVLSASAQIAITQQLSEPDDVLNVLAAALGLEGLCFSHSSCVSLWKRSGHTAITKSSGQFTLV